jgi:RimJ/RimL family protein N-acetyltransferase
MSLQWPDLVLVDGDLVLRAWRDGDQERLGTSQRDPEIGRYFGRATDLAYLRQDCWGRGLATRSLCLVSDWLLGEPGVHEIVLCTHPDNVRSQAVAERAGYVRDGVVDPYAEFKDLTTLALRYVRRA